MGYIVDGKIVKDFGISEMMCKTSGFETSLILSPDMVKFAQMMQELRDWYGNEMRVDSWYRTPSINRKIGGSPISAHLDGRACDIVFRNLTDELFNKLVKKWETICENHKMIGGIIRYDWGMHFTNYENKFGNTSFVIKDKRTQVQAKTTKLEKQIEKEKHQKKNKKKKK